MYNYFTYRLFSAISDDGNKAKMKSWDLLAIPVLNKTAMTLICKKRNRLDTKVASELTIYSPKFGGVEHCALLHIIVMHMGPIISM